MNAARGWRFLSRIFILGSAFGLRLYRLDFQSIWWDEGHSIFVAKQPIPHIPILPAMDVHPPAYFILLRLWLTLVGSSEFALRYLSVIFSLLTVAILWRFAQAMRPPTFSLLGPRTSFLRAPFLAALFAALSPLYVAYAQEVRSYAMLTCLASVSAFALWRIVNSRFKGVIPMRAQVKIFYRPDRGPRTEDRLFAACLRSPVSGLRSIFRGERRPTPLFGWLTLYIFSTAASLYTHYFTVFLLLFQNLVWSGWIVYHYIAARKQMTIGQASPPRVSPVKSRATVWFISQGAIFLLFIPQLRLALRQVTTYTNPNLTPPGLAHFVAHTWQAYTVGLTIDPTPAQWGMDVILAVLVISHLLLFVICHLSRFISARKSAYHPPSRPSRPPAPPLPRPSAPPPPCSPALLFLIAWFIIPLAAYFIVLQRQPSFEPRYMMLVSPALFLLLAIGLSRLYQGSRATPAAGRFMVYGLRFTVYAFFLLLTAVFSFSLYSYYTNETYFKDDSAGVAAWLARETTAEDIVYVDVPHPFHYYDEEIPAPARYLFVDIHTAAETLNREAAGRERLYWIVWRGSDTDPRGVIPFLAEKAGQLLGRRDFKGYQVRWYDLTGSSAQFSLPEELNPFPAIFGDVLRLDGVAYPETMTAGDSVWLTLHFTLLRSTAVDYRVSVRLQGEDGRLIQDDRDLLNDRHFRTSAWPAGDPALNQAVNVYTLPPAPPGVYRLEVVVYDAEPPYPSEGVSGIAGHDGVSAPVGKITITP